MRIRLAERSYVWETDRALLKHHLKKLTEDPEDQKPEAFKELVGQKSESAIDQFVDGLYNNTILADLERQRRTDRHNLRHDL